MKFESIMKTMSNMTGRTGLLIQKNSPEILLAVGVVGTITSTVLACRATLKVEDVIDAHRDKVDKINHAWEKVKDGEISLDAYSENDRKRDLTVTYVQTGVDFIKLYGPAVTLGVASIACIVGGHGIMKRRNLALVAAYKAVEEGFAAYRKRVIEEYGEDKDYMYKNGLRSEIVTETEVDEDGKTRKVKKEKIVPIEEGSGLSIYARYFDESCSNWSKTPEYNLMFLKAQQNYFNDMLKVRGHVFLNEVYDALGIPRTSAGSQVGWVLGNGDDFIDFGIYDTKNDKYRTDRTFETISEERREFVNGYRSSIILDFNVDGVIYDLI